MRIIAIIPEATSKEAEDAARAERVSVSALYAQAVERYLRGPVT